MKLSHALSGLVLALVATATLAQATVKPDGRWRHLFTAGVNLNGGNTRSSAANLSTDSVLATDSSKWSATGQFLYTASEGQTTGDRVAVSTQYNGDFEPWRNTFAFVQAAGVRDRPANTQDRLTLTTGLGAHLMREPDQFWDIWAGLAVAQERFLQPTLLDGVLRRRTSDSGLVLAQEANLNLRPGVTLRQKLVLLPSLRESGLMLTEFDALLTVTLSERLNLSTGLTLRHNTHPAPGVRRTDSALVTGLSLRWD